MSSFSANFYFWVTFSFNMSVLLGEASELNSTVSALQQQLYEACKSLSDLEESRLFLEKDISCKTNSLLIDREKCMTHHTCYPSVTVLSGY
uniref:Tektin n=1 Tax=Cyprinus carpio TaxID=7962 RepID=A0A8C2INC9_CYPCA